MQLKNRKKGRKKYTVKKRDEHILTEKPGKWLAVDFVIDSIANKRQLKNLTVIDPVSKVTPKIIPAYSMQGEGVAEILNEIWVEEQFLYLQTDNGPEFRSYAVQSWCKKHAVTQIFSRPGKPNTNFNLGEFVTANQVLGYTGNTGPSTGPHLHWEYRLRYQYWNNRNK